MATWPQKPAWHDISTINAGIKYNAQDGVTVDDMNNIIENMIYLKKYGGKINALSIDATVSGTKLILKSEEV